MFGGKYKEGEGAVEVLLALGGTDSIGVAIGKEIL